MNKIAALLIIPPSEVVDLHAPLLKRHFGLFDLNLHAAVCQRERHPVIEKDSHMAQLGPNDRLAQVQSEARVWRRSLGSSSSCRVFPKWAAIYKHAPIKSRPAATPPGTGSRTLTAGRGFHYRQVYVFKLPRHVNPRKRLWRQGQEGGLVIEIP